MSLGGPAGTGKSVLALAAGLEAVLEQRTPQAGPGVPADLRGRRPGARATCPGTESEKMLALGGGGHRRARVDHGPRGHRRGASPATCSRCCPLTHIRGRSLTDSFVIIDEAQNLERSVLLTALSRLGDGSRVVLTHDVAQRDNLRVGRHDGVVSVIEALRGHPLFGHVTLTRSERSPIAALVTALLDGPGLN